MFKPANSTAKLGQAVIKLEAQVKKWANSADEDVRRQWRLSRGKLAKAKFKLAERLEKRRPFLAVQLYYHSFLLGDESARDKLFKNDAPCSTKAELSPEDIEKSSGYLFIIGLQALSGIGIRQNDAKAFVYFSAAAERGCDRAQCDLGWMYRNGRGVAQDDAQAYEWCRKSAEQGNARAQYNVGWMYKNGRVVAKDDAQAYEWCRKSAEQGYARAQNNLGLMYFEGQGVAQDDAQAYEWCRKSAEQGNARAQYNVGWMYFEGQGVAQDDAQAMAWYRKLAEQGDAVAQNNLGLMYFEGQGVAQDDAQAMAWFRKSAEQGNANAQCYLGWMYYNGRGVTPDDAQAYDWYRKSAEQGDAVAQCNLGSMYYSGRGVAKNDAQAYEWCRKSAEQGHADAQCNLGRLYRNGHGVAQDDVQAYDWYRKSAEQGVADAQRNLGNMYKEGSPALPIIASAAIDYRIDYALGVKEALIALKKCANLEVFEGRYHHAMVLSLSKQRNLSEEEPNDFSEILLQDDLLDNDDRFPLAKAIFDNHHREKSRFFELDKHFEGRKLSPANEQAITYLVANYQYARLAHVKKPEERQQRIDALIQCYGIFTEDFAHYAEIQLVLAHLHYLNKNEKWETCFNTALEHDHTEEVIGWLNPHLPRLSYENGLHNLGKYFNTQASFFNAKQENKQDLMIELDNFMSDVRLDAIKRFNTNNSNHMALIELAVMDVDDDTRRPNRILTLKQIDPTSKRTLERFKQLHNDYIISREKFDILSCDMNATFGSR